MHNVIVGLGFVAMMIAPCVVAARTGVAEAEE